MSGSGLRQSPNSVARLKKDKEAAPEETGGHDSEQESKQDKNKKNKNKKMRKAPQAPRRFKSPYILFSISKMEEYKKQNSGGISNVTSISRRVADEWKMLSEQERNKWDEAARQDKMRYEAETKLYKGPWHISAKRTKKDPSAPKRPPSAFLLYCKTERPRLKRQRPNLKNTEISVLLGQNWKNATPEERNPHIYKEQQEREQYKKEIAEWRKIRDEKELILQKQKSEMVKEHIIQTHGRGVMMLNTNNNSRDENSNCKNEPLHTSFEHSPSCGNTNNPTQIPWMAPSCGSAGFAFLTQQQQVPLSHLSTPQQVPVLDTSTPPQIPMPDICTPPLISSEKPRNQENRQQQQMMAPSPPMPGLLPNISNQTFNFPLTELKNCQTSNNFPTNLSFPTNINNNNNNAMNSTQQNVGAYDDAWIPSSIVAPSSEMIMEQPQGLSSGDSQPIQQPIMDDIQPLSHNFLRADMSSSQIDYGITSRNFEFNPSFPGEFQDSFPGTGTADFDNRF